MGNSQERESRFKQRGLDIYREDLERTRRENSKRIKSMEKEIERLKDKCEQK